jgi:hypothetical protein
MENRANFDDFNVSAAETKQFINHGVKPRPSGRGCKPAGLTLMWRALLFNVSSDNRNRCATATCGKIAW